MNPIVEVRNLTKAYAKFKAVDEVSFAIEENKIYGLLGRNGAGKTTIMQLVTAQTFPTGGQLKVFGEPPYENNRVLSRICFIKESQKYPDNFRVGDVLRISSHLFPNWDEELAGRLAEDFRLPLKRRIKKLSRGMRSSVGIIVGLASRAPLTIFDEPYIGLDAVARTIFYERLLEDYAELPRTVILSTHLIDEVSRMLEHVIVVDQGRVVLNEDADTLRGRATKLAGPAGKVEAFAAGKKVIQRETFGGLAAATVLGEMSAEERKRATEQGLELSAVSLQQLIVHLTGTGIGERETEGNKEAKAK